MMSRKLSVFKVSLISLLLIPLITASIFLSCSGLNEADNLYTSNELVVSMNSRVHKPDPVLYKKEDDFFFTSDILAYSQPYWYDENKELYTGTQRFFDRQNNIPGWEYEYEEGKLIRTTYLNKDIIDRLNFIHIYQAVEEEQLVQTAYHRNDSLVFRRVVSKEEAKTYSANNTLTAHSYEKITNGIPGMHFEHWHPNGQLSFTTFPDSTGRGTILTQYDEEGNIIRGRHFFRSDSVLITYDELGNILNKRTLGEGPQTEESN